MSATATREEYVIVVSANDVDVMIYKIKLGEKFICALVPKHEDAISIAQRTAYGRHPQVMTRSEAEALKIPYWLNLQPRSAL